MYPLMLFLKMWTSHCVLFFFLNCPTKIFFISFLFSIFKVWESPTKCPTSAKWRTAPDRTKSPPARTLFVGLCSPPKHLRNTIGPPAWDVRWKYRDMPSRTWRRLKKKIMITIYLFEVERSPSLLCFSKK